MMQTVFLEFQHENGAMAANGTDVIFFIDGRWSWRTTVDKIEERVYELRRRPTGSRYIRQKFVGITYAGHGAFCPLEDRNPPLWAMLFDEVDPRPVSLTECINWETNEQGDCGGRLFRRGDGSVLCENCANRKVSAS